MNYLIGIDCGTDSVRSVLVTDKGKELCESVFYYPRWMKGLYCDPSVNRFRHHPLDYVEGLEHTLKEVIEFLDADERRSIKAIAVDTTGSTPVAVNAQGIPLSLLPEFEDEPNAMFLLWKDHTAVKEADELTQLASTWGGVDYTQYVGGIYSSEWFWAKILHVLRNDPSIVEKAHSWVELCDWIPFLLTGADDVNTMKRSRCAAGHKAMWHESYEGLPSEEFLSRLDPLLQGLRGRLYEDTYTSDSSAGLLGSDWMKRLGLDHDVHVAVGAFDAHMGAVGGRITSGYMVRVMGTSSCDMILADQVHVGSKTIKGICGQVDGSIIPGFLGLEAGQSGFGDVLAWFKQLVSETPLAILKELNYLDDQLKAQVTHDIEDKVLSYLEREASRINYKPEKLLALDWLNGRRTPDANQHLTASIEGLGIGSRPFELYVAFVQAICFGSRAIVERFVQEGIEVRGIIAMGGVSKKAPYIMQTLADVLQIPVQVVASEQACARGAAIFGAVVAQIYTEVEEAVEHMASGIERVYEPNEQERAYYNHRYQEYCALGIYTEQKIMEGLKA